MAPFNISSILGNIFNPLNLNPSSTLPSVTPASDSVDRADSDPLSNYIDINTNISKPNVIGQINAIGTFGVFGYGDIVPDNKQDVTEACWSGGIGGTMSTFYSSSAQYSSSGDYYINIYNFNPQTDARAEIQFAAAYAHYYGSGSAPINSLSGNSGLTPTKAIYSQYSNLLLPATSDKFVTKDGAIADELIVINFDRARIKQRLDVGNWELVLSGSENTPITLIDDSIINATPTITEGGKVYNILSGSMSTATAYETGSNYVYYGLMYPEHGILILNAAAISSSIGLDLDRTPSGSNNALIYESLNLGGSFSARNSQTINSTYYFVRLKNSEFNFSTNPTYVTGSYGDLRFTEMIGNPRTYITTIGLYNDKNELLAVAKVSRPILKSFNSEVLFRVKLDF